MGLALIADIHGNLAALDAVIAALKQEQPDRVICLGDVASTGPQPHEVLGRLRATGWPVVMGNADAELLAPIAIPDTNEDARKIADISRWCAAQLDDADRAHERTRGHGQRAARGRAQVLLPVGEQVRELVGASGDGHEPVRPAHHLRLSIHLMLHL